MTSASPDAHVGEQTGTRSVTGIGKGLYYTATARGNLPAPPYATAAIFSKPFFSSSGELWETWPRAATGCDTAGESPCSRCSPGAGGLGGMAAAQECYQFSLKLTLASYYC